MGVISRMLIGEGRGDHFTFYPSVAIAALIGGFVAGSGRRLSACSGPVLSNLPRKARKALADCPGAETTISTVQVGSTWSTAMFNGPGLADDVRELLFEPMTSTKANGMGNGRSISKSTTEADYGRIWAESDTGATFSFALLLTAAEIEE
jgi:C4-dicarboxylate-specific signal transduction histidine kinase